MPRTAKRRRKNFVGKKRNDIQARVFQEVNVSQPLDLRTDAGYSRAIRIFRTFIRRKETSNMAASPMDIHNLDLYRYRIELINVLNMNISAIKSLKEAAINFATPKYQFKNDLNRPKYAFDIILTAGSWSYKDAILNWIAHIRMQKIDNYIVLCFDHQIYDIIDALSTMY